MESTYGRPPMRRGNLREARASPCPHGDEIAEALQHAQAIYDFVLRLVPREAKPA